MDYGPMLAYHVEQNADMTVGCIEVPLAEASAFGVMSIDADSRVVKFSEKPTQPEAMPGVPDLALASMGIYIFNTVFLYEQLIKDADNSKSAHDFGHDIIPGAIDKYRVMAYRFRDPATGKRAYWRDVGTIDAYWRANMELIAITPELNLYDREWPIWTYQEQWPPAKFVFNDEGRRGIAVDSMVSGGCIISGATVRRSLLFSNVYIESHSLVEDSVILPDVAIGQRCRLRKAVIDKGCVIPSDMVIGEDRHQDMQRFYVTSEGVTLVTPEMLGQEMHHVR
jgi:glucose-1-phosphate adenylyltransferase